MSLYQLCDHTNFDSGLSGVLLCDLKNGSAATIDDKLSWPDALLPVCTTASHCRPLPTTADHYQSDRKITIDCRESCMCRNSGLEYDWFKTEPTSLAHTVPPLLGPGD
jgi:hypothetical protein